MNGLGVALVLIALAGLLWNGMSAFESWRYLRARRRRTPFRLRIRFMKSPPARRPATVYRFPERTRAS